MDKGCVFAKLGIQRRVEDPWCKLNHAANYAVGFDNQVRSSARVSQKLKYSKSPSTLSLSGFSKQLQLSACICLSHLSPILLILSLLILMVIRSLPAAVSFSLMTWDVADFGFFVYLFVCLLVSSFLSRSWVEWRLDDHFLFYNLSGPIFFCLFVLLSWMEVGRSSTWDFGIAWLTRFSCHHCFHKAGTHCQA